MPDFGIAAGSFVNNFLAAQQNRRQQEEAQRAAAEAERKRQFELQWKRLNTIGVADVSKIIGLEQSGQTELAKAARQEFVDSYAPLAEHLGVTPDRIYEQGRYIAGHPGLRQKVVGAYARGEIDLSQAMEQMRAAGASGQSVQAMLTDLQAIGSESRARAGEERSIERHLERHIPDSAQQFLATKYNVVWNEATSHQQEEAMLSQTQDQMWNDLSPEVRNYLARDGHKPGTLSSQAIDKAIRQIHSDQISMVRGETEARNQANRSLEESYSSEFRETLARKHNVSVDNATQEQIQSTWQTLGAEEIYNGLPSEVKGQLTAWGIDSSKVSPEWVQAATDQTNANQVDQRQAEAAATQRGKQYAQSDRAITGTDLAVVEGWASQFRTSTGRPPTYRDAIQAGIAIPEREIARQFLARKTGAAQVANTVNRLIESIAETGVGFRGPAPRVAQFITNVAADFQGLTRLMNSIDPSFDPGFFRQEESLILNDDDAFKALTYKGREARVLTTRLAFALARADGLQGRAVTATILKEFYLPQAVAHLNDPEIAVESLRNVAQWAQQNFNEYQTQVLGVNAPSLQIDISGATVSNFDGDLLVNPGETESDATLRKYRLFRERHPEIFQGAQ